MGHHGVGGGIVVLCGILAQTGREWSVRRADDLEGLDFRRDHKTAVLSCAKDRRLRKMIYFCQLRAYFEAWRPCFGELIKGDGDDDDVFLVLSLLALDGDQQQQATKHTNGLD